jgi:hypothetical protein
MLKKKIIIRATSYTRSQLCRKKNLKVSLYSLFNINLNRTENMYTLNYFISKI